MIHNMVGGGGQGEGPVEAGTIVVKYPAGATCTVTNGSDTYTALDTSGAAAFIVEPGTWTVKAVQGSNTKSQSVTVTAGGWIEVELSFWHGELFENGLVVCNGETINWVQNTNLSIYEYPNTGTVTVGTEISCNAPSGKAAIATLEQMEDLTGWNTLSVNFPSNNAQNAAYIIVHSNASGNYQTTIGLLAHLTVSGTGVTTLDISGVNQAAYISIGTNNSGRNFTVDSVKLS